MRIGLLGAGRIGQMHGHNLRTASRVDELLVADAAPERARGLAAELGASAADTPEEVFSAGVDGVVIATATDAHPVMLELALRHGVPALCEKPIAADLAVTRALVERIEQAGLAVQVGLQRRFDAGYRAVREQVRSGELGWVHSVRAVTADEQPPPPEFIPASGGLLRDCGIHDFDMLRWITGSEVSTVHAQGGNRGADYIAEGGDVDTAAVVAALESGTLATVSASRYNGAGHDVRMEVCGSRGAGFVGHDERAPLPSVEQGVAWPSGRPYRTFAERFGPAYRVELEAFTALVAGEAVNPCAPREALEALRVAEAAQLSLQQGRPVHVAEVREEPEHVAAASG
ncbi:Gfo/Idh/MocA family oxidoreductase [Salinifilum aidingensis]